MQHNTSIVAMNNDFNELSFLESLFIKMHKPKLNTGIRAANEIVLFNQKFCLYTFQL